MKCVQKEKFILHVLKDTKSKKLRKAILSTCSDQVIQTLAEIVHNILKNNVNISQTDIEKLRKYKLTLRRIHSELMKKKKTSERRKIFLNQKGGFLTPLLASVLSALVEYGVNKLT